MNNATIIMLYTLAAFAMIGLIKMKMYFHHTMDMDRKSLQEPTSDELLKILVLHGQWLFIRNWGVMCSCAIVMVPGGHGKDTPPFISAWGGGVMGLCPCVPEHLALRITFQCPRSGRVGLRRRRMHCIGPWQPLAVAMAVTALSAGSLITTTETC